MTISGTPGAPASPPVRDPVPRLVRDLVHERIGIFFEDDRLDSLQEKLEPRLPALGCRSWLDYYYVLKYDEKGPQEWRRVMDAFSIQETYFWREYDQIRLLVDRVVPAWFAETARPLRIWSAACATGEEPYSIALALQEAGWGAHPIEILASDASEAALAKARQGLYRERSFRSLPPDLRARYFTREGDQSLLSPDIRGRVTFHWANLMSLEDLPEAGSVQVIFCRNVFIYFSEPAIRRVVAAFADRLPLGGQLFVGASESLLKLSHRFDLEHTRGAFVYVRNATA